MSAHFRRPGESSLYQYDFVDGWLHTVDLEKIVLRDKGVSYPRCIAGRNQCPPADCGGASGYEDICGILANPKHPEYQ